MRKLTRKVLQIKTFTPSERLQNMAEKLLMDYDENEIAHTIRWLSRNINREGEVNAEESTNVDDLGQLIQGGDQQKAAGHVLEIGDMIVALSKREAFKWEGDNTLLTLFDPAAHRVLPPIEKCLRQIGSWCIEQKLDYVDEQATAIAEKFGIEGKANAAFEEKIIKLDRAAGLLVKISEISDAVQAEIAQKNKEERLARRVGRAAG